MCIYTLNKYRGDNGQPWPGCSRPLVTSGWPWNLGEVISSGLSTEHVATATTLFWLIAQVTRNWYFRPHTGTLWNRLLRYAQLRLEIGPKLHLSRTDAATPLPLAFQSLAHSPLVTVTLQTPKHTIQTPTKTESLMRHRDGRSFRSRSAVRGCSKRNGARFLPLYEFSR